MNKHYTINVEERDEGSRLDSWLSKRYKELNFNKINVICRKGGFRVNGRRIKSSYRLKTGDVIKIPNLNLFQKDKEVENRTLSKITSERIISALIFKDDYLLGLNKPEGIATQGGTKQGNNHLDAYRSVLRFGYVDLPRLVHRLDKDTSGIILLARDGNTAKKIASKFKKKEIQKFYWALVQGTPTKDTGVIEGFIGEEDIWRPRSGLIKEKGNQSFNKKINTKKFALTYYKVIERIGSKYSWLLLCPSTGRTHQLRIHTSFLGTPIIGDRKYKKNESEHVSDFPEQFKKLFLHARSMEFTHPETGDQIVLQAKLPQHMLEVWKFFGWNPDNNDFLLEKL